MTKQSLSPRRKIALGALVGAGLVVGGQKLATDSPVHFLTDGAPPIEAPEWVCTPEGGLIGAPVVCRYVGSAAGSAGLSANGPAQRPSLAPIPVAAPKLPTPAESGQSDGKD